MCPSIGIRLGAAKAMQCNTAPATATASAIATVLLLLLTVATGDVQCFLCGDDGVAAADDVAMVDVTITAAAAALWWSWCSPKPFSIQETLNPKTQMLKPLPRNVEYSSRRSEMCEKLPASEHQLLKDFRTEGR